MEEPAGQPLTFIVSWIISEQSRRIAFLALLDPVKVLAGKARNILGRAEFATKIRAASRSEHNNSPII